MQRYNLFNFFWMILMRIHTRYHAHTLTTLKAVLSNITCIMSSFAELKNIFVQNTWMGNLKLLL